MGRWQIHRRAFLRGVGVAMALPMLDAMAPSIGSVVSAATATPGKMPKRMAFIYVPNGATMADWTPTMAGRTYDLPRILQPLEKYRDDFNIISGMDQKMGSAMGDGAGDHARASATFLTGVHPRKTAGSNIRAGVSVDQIAAQAIGDQTRLPSLELSCDSGPRSGGCDSGYACAYQYNIAWKSESMPLNPEVDPRQAFHRLFGGALSGESPEMRSRRDLYRRSILDLVRDDARSLHRQLGRSDQRKLDQYLTAVREIEQRVALNERHPAEIPVGVSAPDLYTSFQEHIRLMMDMLVLAFQTDSTRIATFIIGHEGSNRAYPFIGVKDGHHDLSHHRNDPDKIQNITRINTFHIEQLAYFLERMKTATEADGSSLLDNSMVIYGSGLSDGNRHDHEDLPVLLAGRGGGTVTTGRHIRCDDHTPLNNLYLSMLDRIGAPIESFGDSTGKLEAIA